MTSAETARRFHGRTTNPARPAPRPPGLRPFRRMDPRNAPEPFLRYPGVGARALPTGLAPAGAPAVDVLRGHVPSRSGSALDVETLARLLLYSGGVTRTIGVEPRRVSFRAAASAGNLHPLETYVVAGEVDGVPAGVHHLAPDAYALEPLRDGDHRGHLADTVTDDAGAHEPGTHDAGAYDAVVAAPAALVVAGLPWRTAWKYAERGWRHLYWDAGTMLANLLAVADAQGVQARLWFGFRDAALCRLLGLDGSTAFPVAVVTLDTGAPGGDQAAATTGDVSAGDVPASTPVAPAPVELPLVTEAQRAGDLDDPAAVRSWRGALRADHGTTAASAGHVPASPPAGSTPDAAATAGGEPPSGEPMESVILRRGSTRRMRRTTVPGDLLTWALACATRPVPADVLAPDTTLLSHFLSVHDVAGVPSGLHHRQEGGRLEPLRRIPPREARAAAAHLCLDQDLGGDAAYTLFACADLEPTLETLGARGYRVAQTEAGVVVGRLQLAAFALGYGATGLTFYDDEVAEAFGTRTACMMACAVGVPAYRSRPGRL